MYTCSDENNTSTPPPPPPPPVATTGVTVKINGLPQSFSKVDIIQTPVEENGIPRVDIHVTAANPNDETEYIQFGVGKGDIGQDQIWAFIYVKNGTLYEIGDAGLANEVTTNADNKIVGAFAGTVTANSENLILTDGIFN